MKWSLSANQYQIPPPQKKKKKAVKYYYIIICLYNALLWYLLVCRFNWLVYSKLLKSKKSFFTKFLYLQFIRLLLSVPSGSKVIILSNIYFFCYKVNPLFKYFFGVPHLATFIVFSFNVKASDAYIHPVYGGNRTYVLLVESPWVLRPNH